MEECERFISFANPANISLVADHDQDSENEEHVHYDQGIIKYAQFSCIFCSIFLYYFSLEVAQ